METGNFGVKEGRIDFDFLSLRLDPLFFLFLTMNPGSAHICQGDSDLGSLSGAGGGSGSVWA